MKTRALLILGLAVSATSAFAQVSIRFESKGLGQNIDMVFEGDHMTVFAGQLNFKNITANKMMQTYCVDLAHTISGGATYNTQVSHTLNDPTFGKAGSIYANSQATIQQNSKAAALQIAVWAARYGTNLQTNSGGTFRLSNSWYNSHTSIINDAIAMTNLGKNNPADALLYNPNPIDCGQAQLGPVPEPASMLALGVGIVGLMRKRKKAK